MTLKIPILLNKIKSMPHFVIECSDNVLDLKPAREILQAVYQEAQASGLFAKNDIKVRIHPYQNYKIGEGKEHFLHVFAYIMEGRSSEQKATLSKRIVAVLNELLPELSILSMNVTDFDKATYCNKAVIHPDNKTGDRHFGL